jgi:hypothetical protein
MIVDPSIVFSHPSKAFARVNSVAPFSPAAAVCPLHIQTIP